MSVQQKQQVSGAGSGAAIDLTGFKQSAAWLVKFAKRPVVPVLGTVNVAVSDGGVLLRATDYDIWREVKLGEPDPDGAQQIQVNARELAALTKGMTGPGSVAIVDNALEVSTSALTVRLDAAADVSDWPLWPVFEAEAEAVVTVDSVKRVLTAVGTSSSLPMLESVWFSDGHMSSTDRFRAVREALPGDRSLTGMVSRHALKLFAVGRVDVVVQIGKPYAKLSRDGHVVLTKLAADTFPATNRIIDAALDDNRAIVEFDRRELLSVCRGWSVVIEGEGDDALTVRSLGAGDAVVALSRITAQLGSSLPLVRFNTDYLVQALKSCPKDRVELRAAHEGGSQAKTVRPVLLRWDSNTEYLLMPVRHPA
ncbi:DNA polymerase III subunit beta [Mycobacteroides abscessus]|uniref:DNA polymerase III subunit beta n=1 Tax=Mycobacteroides abscessus TaxID=36809 RepID=UPI00210499B1|nr:DNA polymerase III subunit beta [Mycobacteroides abscessus]